LDQQAARDSPVEPAAGGSATGRGVYNWLGNVYSVFGNTLYKDGIAVTGTVDTTNGSYKFSSCLNLYTPNVSKLQLGNGVKAYNYDASNGLVLISAAAFPAAFVKGWAYLNSVTYVGKSTGAIQGSDPDNPILWDALDVLYAAIEPDLGVALAKQLVYVVMFKQWSTEIFYDAQNATGSALAPVQGAKVNYGCAHADSISAVDEGILLWLSSDRTVGRHVIKMEGLKADIVSTDPVERLLVGFDLTTIYSFGLKVAGHRFYVLTSVTSNLTLVYDLDTRMWQQWTDSSGNYFPFCAVTSNSSNQIVLQHATDGKLYLMSPTYYTDDGSVITVDIVTPNFDGGTNRRKQMTMMKFIADQTQGSILHVRKNDHDYTADKWSNFRSVDLSRKQPVLTNCGSFVRRAHHFRHQSQTVMRVREIELQMDLGTL